MLSRFLKLPTFLQPKTSGTCVVATWPRPSPVPEESTAFPVIDTSTQPKYKHTTTRHSPSMLAALPTEVMDHIISFLDEWSLRKIRATHSIFQHSAQAAIFQDVELYSFRHSTRPSGVEQFLNLLENNERLRGYVHKVTIGSILDPTVETEVRTLLPPVLSMLEPARLTLSFRMIQGFTQRSQMSCVVILRDIFKDLKIPDITLLCEGVSSTIFAGLRELNPTSIVLTYRPNAYDPYQPPNEGEWSKVMGIVSIRRLDLGVWRTDPENMTKLLEELPNLTDLSMSETYDTTASQLLAVLRPRQHSLRKLSLYRRDNSAHTQTDLEALDLSSFTALKQLTIDSSYLFGSALCYAGARPDQTLESLALELEITSQHCVEDLLPAQLKSLVVILSTPRYTPKSTENIEAAQLADYQNASQVRQRKNYAWMVERVQRRCKQIDSVRLTEHDHICSVLMPELPLNSISIS